MIRAYRVKLTDEIGKRGNGSGIKVFINGVADTSSQPPKLVPVDASEQNVFHDFNNWTSIIWGPGHEKPLEECVFIEDLDDGEKKYYRAIEELDDVVIKNLIDTFSLDDPNAKKS